MADNLEAGPVDNVEACWTVQPRASRCRVTKPHEAAWLWCHPEKQGVLVLFDEADFARECASNALADRGNDRDWYVKNEGGQAPDKEIDHGLGLTCHKLTGEGGQRGFHRGASTSTKTL
jgi:hypothetical protein